MSKAVERANLERSRKQSKLQKRLRARFEGNVKDRVRCPGFTFEPASEDAVKQWKAAW